MTISTDTRPARIDVNRVATLIQGNLGNREVGLKVSKQPECTLIEVSDPRTKKVIVYAVLSDWVMGPDPSKYDGNGSLDAIVHNVNDILSLEELNPTLKYGIAVYYPK